MPTCKTCQAEYTTTGTGYASTHYCPSCRPAYNASINARRNPVLAAARDHARYLRRRQEAQQAREAYEAAHAVTVVGYAPWLPAQDREELACFMGGRFDRANWRAGVAAYNFDGLVCEYDGMRHEVRDGAEVMA